MNAHFKIIIAGHHSIDGLRSIKDQHYPQELVETCTCGSKWGPPVTLNLLDDISRGFDAWFKVEPEDVCFVLVGHEWLYDKDVLTFLSTIYADHPTLLMTYGRKVLAPEPVVEPCSIFSPQTIANNDYRKQPSYISQLITFRGKLWDAVSGSACLVDPETGKLFEDEGFQALSLALLEAAGPGRLACLQRLTCVGGAPKAVEANKLSEQKTFQTLSAITPSPRKDIPFTPSSEPQKIPKIIHQAWLGGSTLPDNFSKWMSSWKEFNPTWEYRLWTDSDVEREFPGLSEIKSPAFRADFLRLEIIKKYGGVYADCDFQCLKSFEGLLDGVDAFSGLDRNDRVYAAAIFGSVKEHDFLKEVIKETYRTREIIEREKKISIATIIFGNLAADRIDVHLFPPGIFYPYTYTEMERASEKFENAYAVHHWGRTWDSCEESSHKLFNGKPVK